MKSFGIEVISSFSVKVRHRVDRADRFDHLVTCIFNLSKVAVSLSLGQTTVCVDRVDNIPSRVLLNHYEFSDVVLLVGAPKLVELYKACFQPCNHLGNSLVGLLNRMVIASVFATLVDIGNKFEDLLKLLV